MRLVFPRADLRVHFFDQIKNHRNCNEESGTADSERLDVGEGLNDKRQNGNNTKEKSPDQSKANKNFRYMFL